MANQLSFLPDDYLERKAQRRANVLCAGLAVVVIATVGAAFSFTEARNRKVDDENLAVQAKFADAAKIIEKVQNLQDKQRTMAHEAELSESLLEKAPRSYILAQVTNSLPNGVSLLSFSLDCKRAAKTNQAPVVVQASPLDSRAMAAAAAAPPPPTADPIVYDVTIKLTGVADTDGQVATFIGKLSKLSLLKDVNLVVSDEFALKDAKMRRFELSMTLNPDAEVTPADVASAAAAVEAK